MLKENIKFHIDNSMLMTIERSFNKEKDCITGFPLMQSQDYILTTIIVDFHDEGYAILRMTDVTDAYSEKVDEFRERICIEEGLQSKGIPDCMKDVSEMHKILTQLKDYNGLISIQCEEQIEKCSFYLGRIVEVCNECVIFKDLDMEGNWDKQSDKIPFCEITQITFGDNYSKMFYKYIDDKG